jgi:DNA-binding NarL/FixJ family response regulator
MMGADDPAKAQEALAGGAVGYVVENAARELLIEAVRAVARGGVWLSESVADGLFGGVQTAPGERGEGLLTARERDVLRLIARGHDNEAISRDLCLGRQTVRNYVSRIYGKLGVRYRGEVIVWAREHGFGSV